MSVDFRLLCQVYYFHNSLRCLWDLSVCMYLWRCSGKDKWCCQGTAPHREATDQIVKEKASRREEEEKKGHKLGRLERRECRSGEQWEGEDNRISKKGAWDPEINEGVSAALQGCFLSHCLFWGVKVTQGHNVQVPVYLGSISDLSPLSLSLPLCVCNAWECVRAFVYTGVSQSICLCLFEWVFIYLYFMWACIWVCIYTCSAGM